MLPLLLFFFSSRRRHTRFALVTGVQTCALPISISLNDRQALRELRLHRDIVFHHFATGQGNDLNDRFVELQGILPRGLLLDESTDAADDLGRTPSVLDGTTQRLPAPVQIWRLGTQQERGRRGLGDPRDTKRVGKGKRVE